MLVSKSVPRLLTSRSLFRSTRSTWTSLSTRRTARSRTTLSRRERRCTSMWPSRTRRDTTKERWRTLSRWTRTERSPRLQRQDVVVVLVAVVEGLRRKRRKLLPLPPLLLGFSLSATPDSLSELCGCHINHRSSLLSPFTSTVPFFAALKASKSFFIYSQPGTRSNRLGSFAANTIPLKIPSL